jgi:hypothetical protein
MVMWTVEEVSLMCFIVMVLRTLPIDRELHSFIACLVVVTQRHEARLLRMYHRRLERAARRRTRWMVNQSIIDRHGEAYLRETLAFNLMEAPGRHLLLIGQPQPPFPIQDDCIGPDSEGEDSCATPPNSPQYSNSSDEQ